MYAAFTCRFGGPPAVREAAVTDEYIKELDDKLFSHYPFGQQRSFIYRLRRDADEMDEIRSGLKEVYDDEEFDATLEKLYRNIKAFGIPCYINGIYEVDCERWVFDIREDGKIHEFHLTWLQDLPTEELEAIKEFHEKWQKEHQR